MFVLRTVFLCPTKMEVNDSELKNEIQCVIKFCYHSGKTATKTIILTKQIYKDKCFDEFTIFGWHNDFKKGRLPAEFAF